ncbi:MAG: hypothetical protein WC503_05375 [Candidatus Shapirobacteria bacterium]
MSSTKELKNYRRQVYCHPDRFIQRWTDAVMTENRDSPDRDYMGIDHLNQHFSPLGLPTPFIDQNNLPENTSLPESSVEIRSKYEDFCRLTDRDIENWGPEEIQSVVVSLVMAYQRADVLDNLPAGHDLGHYWRDIINAVRIYDSVKDQAASRADLLAGIIGGLFHDTGLALTERYQDGKRAIAHAETSALKFWDLSAGIIPDSLRQIITYGISAHTHVLKDKNVPSGFTVKPYWDELWEDPEGKLYGLAWRLPRMTDRLDCNGASFVFRNIVSKEDPKNESGIDYSGQSDHPLSKIYPQILKPILRPTEEIDRDGGFTALEHPRNFAKSNDGTTPYSHDDYRYSGYQRLMAQRVYETNSILDVESDSALVVTQELKRDTYKDFVTLARKVMCLTPNDSKYAEVFIRLEKHWQTVVDSNDDYVRRWAAIIPQMEKLYNSWMESVADSRQSSELKSLISLALEKLNP